VYLQQVDEVGHNFGLNTPNIKVAIGQTDLLMTRINQLLERGKFPDQTEGNMWDRVNVAAFSDHGMTERVGGSADNNSAVIRLFDYVDSTEYLRAEGSKVGPILSIWPKEGKVDEVGGSCFKFSRPLYRSVTNLTTVVSHI